MSLACGSDIVYIPNIQKMTNNPELLKKFFHQSELENTKPEHLAGVLAAKEAFFKALGIIPKFTEIQVTYETSGKPQLSVSPQLQTYKSADISISHDNDYAVAFVVLEL